MARNEFTRTITETTVNASIVKLVEGKVVTEPCLPFPVKGKIDEAKAVELARKQYGKDKQYVASITAIDTTYALSVDDFMKYAHKVEPKPETAGNKAE